MSEQEVLIVRLAFDGLTTRQMAETIGISRQEVDSTLSRIYRKLGLFGRRARFDLGVWWVRTGHIHYSAQSPRRENGPQRERRESHLSSLPER